MEIQKIINRPDTEQAWQLFVNHYIDVFTRALIKLQQSESDIEYSINENILSAKLAANFLKQACYELSIEQHIQLCVPQWERPIPPDDLQNLHNGQLGKRPDFTCVCPNRRPGSHENYEYYLNIECKLLGKRIENQKNYVVNGIQRFDDDHQYGKNALTGFMIGYLIGGEMETLQKNVNKFIDTYTSEHKHLQISFNPSFIGQDSCSFKRKNVTPFDFTLVHIWVDLR
ncbi:MAG: hypothetical protein LBB88_07130 [Planctomycetaceae bacterium]|jgi:hypothetical protein|nr:hypothetical protein [Planctomycetaceae bacterium]